MTAPPVTRDATRAAAVDATRDAGGAGLSYARMGKRPVVSGMRLLDPTTLQPIQKGLNFGTWGRDFLPGELSANDPGDGALTISLNANACRIVLRMDGVYTTGTNSMEPNAGGYIGAKNRDRLLAILRDNAKNQVWTVIAIDDQCVQDGAQASQIAWCDPQGIFGPYSPDPGTPPNPGANFVNDLSRRGRHKAVIAAVIALTWEIDYILGIEFLPEPLSGRDASVAAAVVAFYRECFAVKDQYDPLRKLPGVVGPRDAYNASYIEEVLIAERSDVVYTWDSLSFVTTNQAGWDAKLGNATAFMLAHNVPGFTNQLMRNTSADPTLKFQKMGLFWHNAWGVARMYWQKDQNTADASQAALYTNPGGVGRTPKQTEIDTFTAWNAMTLASLEAAAIAAATAAGGVLFYVKADLSNVKQDSAGTTPVTAAGQPVGLVNPVVGAGLTLSQATTSLCPTLVALAPSTFRGDAVTRYGLQFDGVDDILLGSSAYWASGNDVTAIVAGTPVDTAAQRIALHAGNGTTNARYPFLGLAAGDTGSASFRGDDTVLSSCDDTMSLAVRPCVLTASLQGLNKRLLVNGDQGASTTVTTAVGSIATFNRLRVGGSTVAAFLWGGPIALVFVGKTVTEAQRIDIERFGAFLIGAAYLA